MRSGYCVDESFSAEAFWDLDNELREMANECLDFSERQAIFCFQIFVHHGKTPWVPRENMKPVFSVSFQPNVKGTKVLKTARFIDEDFLGCSENGGCGRCGMRKGD